MAWQAFFYVGIGGFLGANARYFISTLLTNFFVQKTNIPLPFGTAFVNVTGSMLLALFTVWISRKSGIHSDSLKLMVATGFFGAYTTFSTFANESINLIYGEKWLLGWGYIFGSNLLCLIGVLVGIWLAVRIWTV